MTALLQLELLTNFGGCSYAFSLVHTCALSITQAQEQQKGTCSFFLVLMLVLMSLVLCLSHKCEPGFRPHPHYASEI